MTKVELQSEINVNVDKYISFAYNKLKDDNKKDKIIISELKEKIKNLTNEINRLNGNMNIQSFFDILEDNHIENLSKILYGKEVKIKRNIDFSTIADERTQKFLKEPMRYSSKWSALYELCCGEKRITVTRKYGEYQLKNAINIIQHPCISRYIKDEY